MRVGGAPFFFRLADYQGQSNNSRSRRIPALYNLYKQTKIDPPIMTIIL